MALKHLTLAAELLRSGMPMADIREIIKMKDDQAEGPEPKVDDLEPKVDDPDDGQNKGDGQPKDKPAEPVKPTKRPETNNEPSTMVDDLNKLF